MASSFRTMEALRMVLGEARDPAMEEVMREMERARMTAEDYAQGSARAPVGLSWRAREAQLLRGVDRMGQALDGVTDAIDGVNDGAHGPDAAVAVIGDLLDTMLFPQDQVAEESDDEPAAARAPDQGAPAPAEDLRSAAVADLREPEDNEQHEEEPTSMFWCGACDTWQGRLAWFAEPFVSASGRVVFAACPQCHQLPNFRDRPVMRWERA